VKSSVRNIQIFQVFATLMNNFEKLIIIIILAMGEVQLRKPTPGNF